MSAIFDRICFLISRGEVEVTDHGYDQISARGLLVSDLIDTVPSGEAIEDYPDYHAGPCVLVLQSDGSGSKLHALWGIRSNEETPAVLITAYRPDPKKWSAELRRRS